MAILHRVELQPTKLELLAEWLPRQPWFTGSGTWDGQKNTVQLAAITKA